MIPFNRAGALEILFESEERLTARSYIKCLARQFSLPMTQAKKILKSLVDEGELTYQDLYGGTYVVQNFLKPVRVSRHFFLMPPGIKSKARPHDREISIVPGISFGSGHHPTTRLCLEALDTLFWGDLDIAFDRRQGGIDIGTGSGVLAIAMCLAGLPLCRAFDIDPVSVAEARQNVAANGLDHCIPVVEDYLSTVEPRVSLICANLRYPTLIQLSSLILSTLCPRGVLILSGIRQWEKQVLIGHYSEKGLSLAWDRDEKNWSALIMTHG